MGVKIFSTDFFLYTAGEPTLDPAFLNRVFSDIYSYTTLDSDNAYWGADPAVMYGAGTDDEARSGWPNFVEMDTVVLTTRVNRIVDTSPSDHTAGAEYGKWEGGVYVKIADILPMGDTTVYSGNLSIPLTEADFGINFSDIHKLRILLRTGDGTEGKTSLSLYHLYLECTSTNFVKVYPVGFHNKYSAFANPENSIDKDDVTYAGAIEMDAYSTNSLSTDYDLMLGGQPTDAGDEWEIFPANIHGHSRVHITYDVTVSSVDDRYTRALVYVNSSNNIVHTSSYSIEYGSSITEKKTISIDVQYVAYSQGYENLRVLLAGLLANPGSGAEFQVYDVYMEVFVEGDPPPFDEIISLGLLEATASTESFTVIKQPDFVDTTLFRLFPNDYIYHALSPPANMDSAYDGVDDNTVLFDSDNIGDWGITEVICTYAADSSVGVSHPGWPNFVRSETVELRVKYGRYLFDGGDYLAGIEYGTMDGGGVWTHLGYVLTVDNTSASDIALITLNKNDFGGYEFPKLHELRVRLLTGSGTTGYTRLSIGDISITVSTDTFVRANPTGAYDPGGVWTDIPNIFDGDPLTFAFATNLSTYTGDQQETYSLMVGGTSGLYADSAWDAIPATYLVRQFKYYLSTSPTGGDDIQAHIDGRILPDDSVDFHYLDAWHTNATGYGAEVQPYEGFEAEVGLTESQHIRLLLDGDISKGSDGKQLRVHYVYWNFYVEGDPPVIEEPVTTVPLGYLTGAVSAESHTPSVGGVSVLPSLQSVVSGIEPMAISVGDVAVPVSTVSVLSSVLNFLVDDSGVINLEIPLNLLTTTSSSPSLSVAPGAFSVSAMILNALATHGDSSVTIGDVTVEILSVGANVDASSITFQGSVTVSVDLHALNVSIEDMAVSIGEAQVELVAADTQATAANANIYATTTVSLIDLDMSLGITKAGVAVGVAEVQLPARTAGVEPVDFLLGLSIPLSIPVASATAAGLSLSTGPVELKQKPLGIKTTLPSPSAGSDLQMGYLKLARCYSTPAKITVNNPKRKVKFLFERDLEQVATERSAIDPIVASEKRTKVESQERVVLFKRKREK